MASKRDEQRSRADEPVEIDPITLELARNVFLEVIREMRANIVLTAFGSQIKEAEDFSCALLTADGELIAITRGTPVHLVPATTAVKGALERFGANIAPGDVLMVNDPYRLSSHLNDVAFLAPHFSAGRLRVWICVRGHYLDIGGMTLGSISPVASDIHQEGLVIPFVKIFEAGVANQTIFDLMWANIRLAEERELDVAAMLGAIRLAQNRLAEAYERFGPALLGASVTALLERAERSMRDALSRLPAGEYAYTHWVESTKEPGVAHRINVRLIVEGDHVVVDFSGSSPQVAEPVNGGEATGPGAAFVALKSLLDPKTPFNGGSFRPITVIAETGSVMRSTYPAACGCSSLAMYTGGVAVAAALARAVGRSMCSHGSWGMSHMYVSGWDNEQGRENRYYDMATGGSAATEGLDGHDATANYDKGDFGWFVSTEVIENAFPTLRVECNDLWTDSGGAGTWRGGLGVRRQMRLLDGPGSLTCLVDPAVIPPWGVFGGCSGAPWTVRVRRDNRWSEPGRVPGKCVEFRLLLGDLIEKCSMGAGGYGDPLDRDPERVAADVAMGCVGEMAARDVYGVVLRSGTVDGAATAARRGEIRRDRLLVRVRRDGAAEADALGVSSDVGRRLGLDAGRFVELVKPDRAAVRARLRVRPDLAGLAASAGRDLARTLDIADEETLWLRPLDGAMPPQPSARRA